jgi:hypothetical protein
VRAALALATAATLLLGAADPRAGRVAGEPRRCLTLGQSTAFVIERGNLLVYRQGRKLWVSEPQRGCYRLDPLDTLVIEPFGGQLCAGDRFRTIRVGMTIPGGFCRFGPFVPYTAATK